MVDGRMGVLVGLGDQFHIPKRVKRAGIGETLLGPGQPHHVQVLPEACPALLVGNVVALIGSGETAPTDPEVEAAVAQVIQRGDFLGQTHRVSQGQQEDGCPNAEPARASGDRRRQEQGGRSYRRDGSRSPWGSKVAFGQPDAVEAQGLCRLRRRERLVKRLPLRAAFPEIAFHHQPDVHTRCPSASRVSPALPRGCVHAQG
jgi:hypothetical protein